MSVSSLIGILCSRLLGGCTWCRGFFRVVGFRRQDGDGVGVAKTGVLRALDAFSEDTGLLLHPASKAIKDISMICFLGMRNTFLVFVLYQNLLIDI